MEDRQQQINEWMDKLQRESWNLELLISGFSIFLLIQAQDALSVAMTSLHINYPFPQNAHALAIGLIVVLKLAAFILTFNLLAHILLRGFWIGAIGLRSVQNKIDFDKLRYSRFFTKKLTRKVSSLDQLLVNLDNFSSVIFAFTFLVIFMLISLFLAISFIAAVGYVVTELSVLTDGRFGKLVSIPLGILMITLILSGLIYMIDTLTLGFFKKYKLVSKIYYPIYLLFGTVTLSFIYRGIYYSLISRFSKKKIRLFFVPYVLIIFLSPFFEYDQYIFFPDNEASSLTLSNNFYEDNLSKGEFIVRASIPSRHFSERYLPLFIRYDIHDNPAILASCTNYEPSKDGGIKSGIIFDSGIQLSSPKTPEQDSKKLLDCLSSFYQIYINDSLQTELDFLYFEHPNKGEKGVHTVIDTQPMQPGKQTIFIKKLAFDEKDSLQRIEYALFPFWLEK